MTRLNKGAAAAAVAGAFILGCVLPGHSQEARQQVVQDYGLPPADVGGGSGGPSPDGGDESSLIVRVGKLEDQIRQMNGQIEQLQFENHRLEDQLRKFQEDVDFRFQEGHGKPLPRRSDVIEPGTAPAPAPLAPLAGDAGSPPARATEPERSRGDAFDPNADPDAPGAPRRLGTTAPSAPLAAAPATGSVASSDPNAPLDLPSSEYKAASPAPPAAAIAPGQRQPDTTAGPVTTPGGTVLAGLPANPTKEEFDVAYGYFKQKDYDNAERSFTAFLQKNPKTHYTSDALYYLGETYYQRGQHKEAAEQYLKISTDYATSPRAAEAMLRLGESLQAMHAKEQACAAFGEVARKYPNASAAVKAGAEREAKRAQC